MKSKFRPKENMGLTKKDMQVSSYIFGTELDTRYVNVA